jgi:hypothetical protein
MKKFLPLLLCLLLSIFTMARATKPAHTPVPDTKTAQNKPRGQQADAKTLLGEEVSSDDDDSTEVPSNNEGQDINDDGGGDARDNENTGDDDEGDDNGGDDGGGDQGE